MPELKAPAFLADLYYDLRDRRLLPLIALVLVAIVAVPILMGSDSESVAPPVGGGALEAPSAQTSSLTVVEATPGLRDYRKRLADRSPTNPFKQRYSVPRSPAGGDSFGAVMAATPHSGQACQAPQGDQERVSSRNPPLAEVETG